MVGGGAPSDASASARLDGDCSRAAFRPLELLLNSLSYARALIFFPLSGKKIHVYNYTFIISIIIIMTEIISSWNSEKAKTVALEIIANNLKSLGTSIVHDPLCSCHQNVPPPLHCYNRVKVCNEITEECLKPWTSYLSEKDTFDRKKIRDAGFLAKNTYTPIQKSFFFITINPHKNIKLTNFLSKFLKYIDSKQFTGYLAVLEQRGTVRNDTIGQGFHAHILFKRKTPLNAGLPPSNIESKCRSSWANFVGDSKSPQLINFQTIQAHEALEKVQYMLDEKWEDKKEKQHADKIWRKTNNLEEYYCTDSMKQDLIKANQ